MVFPFLIDKSAKMRYYIGAICKWRFAIDKIQGRFFTMKNTNKTQSNPQTQTAKATTESTQRNPVLITGENVQTLAEIVAVKALKTNLSSGKGKTADEYQKHIDNGGKVATGGNFNFLWKLYSGLVKDIAERQSLSDGYDIVQEIAVFLCGYIGKYTTDNADNGEKDKDGNPVDIWRMAFRVANRYIMGERQKVYKVAYVDEIDESGNRLFYEIPESWDLPTITDYKRVMEIINALNLTERQMQVLRYRMRGVAVDNTAKGKNGQPSQSTNTSVRTIAQKMGITPRALQKHLESIRAKYTAYIESQTAKATE